MPSLTLRNYEAILQQMISTVVARTSPQLNDLTDSSVFKHLLAAPARALDEAYYQLGLLPDLFNLDTAQGEDLDRRAKDIQPGLIRRRQATKSTGVVAFGRSGNSGSVTIQAGMVVKTADGIAVSTVVPGVIADGATNSGAVAAVAQEAGISGNVAAGSIVAFESKPAGVETVSNPSTFVGGMDVESDDAFRARIKAYVSTLARGTVASLEFAATGVTADNGQRVAFAHAVEDAANRGEVYLYLDDGSGTIETSTIVSTPENLTNGLGGGTNGDAALGGEEFLYTNNKPMKVDPSFPELSVSLTSSIRGALTYGTHYLLNDAGGEFKMTPALVAGEKIECAYSYYGGLIAEVQKIIDGDPDDVETYPGWRAAGVRVHCVPPQILQQLVSASVLVHEGYTKGVPLPSGGYTTGSVLAEVAEAVSAYINNLGISGDVLRSELIAAIMGVPGVANAHLLLPASDVILLDNQLPRVTTANITLT